MSMERRRRPVRAREHRAGREHQRQPILLQMPRESDYDDLIHTTAKSNLPLHSPDRRDDLVRRWLAETEGDAGRYERTSADKYKREYREFSFSRSPQIAFPARREAAYQEEKRISRPRRKKQYFNPSDSSMLEDAAAPPVNPPAGYLAQGKSGNRDKSPSLLERNCDMEKYTRQSKIRPETFEKRPRYKTREDLYEPKDQHENPASHADHRRRGTKQETKREKRRATRKAGEDLMNNFSSEHVENDRLTVSMLNPLTGMHADKTKLRPSNGLGLFNNGRASSPQRQRGLPDLASSKMTFLQQSRAPVTKNQDRTTAKSHDKERRRAEREQLEISTFFQPQRTSMEHFKQSGREDTTPIFISGDPSRGRKRKLSTHHAKKRKSLSPTDSLEPDGSRSNQLGKLLREARTPPDCYPSVPQRNREFNSSEATSVSWSDSHRSPTAMANSRYLRNMSLAQASPIPNSIRRALKQTGIFRDTRIDSTSGVNHARETAPSDRRMALNELPSEACNGRGPVIAAACKIPLNILLESRTRRLKFLDDSQSSSVRGSPIEDQPEQFSSRTCAEHFCHLRDAQEGKLSQTETVVCSKASPCPVSPHLSRRELAQKARIRPNPASMPNQKAAEAEKPQLGASLRSRSPDILDKQDQESQPELCPAIALQKDTAAPDDLSCAPIKEVECQVEDEVKEIAYPEPKVVTQPNLQISANQLPAKRLISDTIQKEHVAIDSLIGLSLLGHTPTCDTAEHHATSFRTSEVYNDVVFDTFIQPAQPLPRAECALPDLIRYRQMNSPEELQTPFAECCTYDPQHQFEHEKIEIMPPGEYFECEYLEQDYQDAPLNDSACVYGRLDDEYRIQEDYHRGQSPFCEMVEEQGEFPCRETDELETWPLVESGAWPGDRTIEDIIPAADSNVPYWGLGDVTEHNQNYTESEDVLTGFWRPYRHY